jgi:hypothetical protein
LNDIDSVILQRNHRYAAQVVDVISLFYKEITATRLNILKDLLVLPTNHRYAAQVVDVTRFSTKKSPLRGSEFEHHRCDFFVENQPI